MSQLVYFKNYYGKYLAWTLILLMLGILLLLVVVSQSTSFIITDRVSTTSILLVIILPIITPIHIFLATPISSVHIWPRVNIIRITATYCACIGRILWIYARLNLEGVTLMIIDSQMVYTFYVSV